MTGSTIAGDGCRPMRDFGNLGFSAEMTDDDRAPSWEIQRRMRGFDETELWSYDSVLMRIVGILLAEVASGMGEDEAETLHGLVALYAADGNCTPPRSVQADILRGHSTLLMVLWSARLADGEPMLQPLARHALPRLVWFRADIAGSHHKAHVRRKRALDRTIRAFRLLENRDMDRLSGRQRTVLLGGLIDLVRRLMPNLWT